MLDFSLVWLFCCSFPLLYTFFVESSLGSGSDFSFGQLHTVNSIQFYINDANLYHILTE